MAGLDFRVDPDWAIGLAQSLQRQRSERHLTCDVTIEIEGRIIKAHRNIIAASNCEKLKELVLSVSDEKNGFCHVNFNQPNSESNESVFDFTYSAVESFLDYIYTGQVNLTSEDSTNEIYKVASFFEFVSLIKICENYLNTVRPQINNQSTSANREREQMTSNDLKNFLSNQASDEFDFSNPFDFSSIQSEVNVNQSETSTQPNVQSEASNIEPDLDLILDSMSGCRSDSNSIHPFFDDTEIDSDSLSLTQSESTTKRDLTKPQTPQQLSFCPDFNSDEINRDQDSEFSDIEPTFVCSSDNTFAQALETANKNQEFIQPNQQYRCGPCKETFV